MTRLTTCGRTLILLIGLLFAALGMMAKVTLAYGEEAANDSSQDSARVADAEPTRPAPQETRRVIGSGRIRTLAFSPDGRILAGGSADGLIRLWPLGGSFHDPIHTIHGHYSQVRAIHFSGDGSVLHSAGQSIKTWDVTSGELIRTTELALPNSDRIFRIFAFSLDGRTVAGRGHSTSSFLTLWDTESGAVVTTIPLVGSPLDAAFSPDGRLLAVGTVALREGRSVGAVQLVDALGGEAGRVMQVHPNSVSAVAFSPDGKFVAGGDHRKVSLWQVDTGDLQQTLEGHSGVIESIAFSPDGKKLISGGQGPIIRFPSEAILLSEAKVWNLETGGLMLSRVGERGRMVDVIFSPDSRSVARCDNASVIWEELEGGRSWTAYFSSIPTIGQRAGEVRDERWLQILNEQAGD